MPARLALDHVVIRVQNLAAAIENYAALGFTVVRGGEHSGLGSCNALIAFEDDAYLELIAFPNGSMPPPVPKGECFRELAAAGRSPLECRCLAWKTAPEGLTDFALVPENIDETVRQARTNGLVLHGPIPGGRLRPDGQQVSWQLAVSDGFDLPFLCADVTLRPLRVPGGPARRHENGALGIKRLAVAVPNLDASAARYRKLLGEEVQQGFSKARTLNFQLGSTAISLVERNADLDLRSESFSTNDEGPCALWLLTENSSKSARLDRSLSHGAWIHVGRDGEERLPT